MIIDSWCDKCHSRTNHHETCSHCFSELADEIKRLREERDEACDEVERLQAELVELQEWEEWVESLGEDE